MKLDFKNKLYVGCIPLNKKPTPPTDQSPCIVEDCKECGEPMWVSEKKRKIRETTPNAEIVCFVCLAKAAIKQGYTTEDIELADINKLN